MGKVWAVDGIALNFPTNLDFTNCTIGFGEIRLKWCHVNNYEIIGFWRF